MFLAIARKLNFESFRNVYQSVPAALGGIAQKLSRLLVLSQGEISLVLTTWNFGIAQGESGTRHTLYSHTLK